VAASGAWGPSADSAGLSLNWGDAGDVEREGLSGVAGAAGAAAVVAIWIVVEVLVVAGTPLVDAGEMRARAVVGGHEKMDHEGGIKRTEMSGSRGLPPQVVRVYASPEQPCLLTHDDSAT
jgi:hypothetical protein